MLNLFRKQSAKEPTTMDIAEKFIDETMDVDHSDATLLKCIMNLSQRYLLYSLRQRIASGIVSLSQHIPIILRVQL